MKDYIRISPTAVYKLLKHSTVAIQRMI